MQWLPKWMQRGIVALTVALALALVLETAKAQDLDKPSLVVALDKLDGSPVYGRSVMVAVPWPEGGHVGFVLNKPTQRRMADLFPSHAPSRAIAEPIYLGGPVSMGVIFVMTRAAESPGKSAIGMGPGVWVLIGQDLIDPFIERTPNAGRYFAGYVSWRAGALAEEVKNGQVALQPFDAGKLFRPDTSSLYDELVPAGRKPAVGA